MNHTFAYASGAPTLLTDPLGLASLCDALKDLLKDADSNHFLNGSTFQTSWAASETIPAGGHGPSDAHFTDSRNKMDYDIQYFQVGWSTSRTRAVGVADSATPMMGLASAVSLDFSYFKPSNIAANVRGSQLGEFAGMNFQTFKDFVNDFCNCEPK